jgi:hypothetical protein
VFLARDACAKPETRGDAYTKWARKGWRTLTYAQIFCCAAQGQQNTATLCYKTHSDRKSLIHMEIAQMLFWQAFQPKP